MTLGAGATSISSSVRAAFEHYDRDGTGDIGASRRAGAFKHACMHRCDVSAASTRARTALMQTSMTCACSAGSKPTTIDVRGCDREPHLDLQPSQTRASSSLHCGGSDSVLARDRRAL